MRLKIYRARVMADAMRQVRAELGPDALILSSRRTAEGVEITAGLEVAEAPVPKMAAPKPVQMDAPQVAALAFHGASAALRRRLGAGPLPFALAAALRFGKLPLEAGQAPLLLAGPPGAGKTLSTVRLATRLVMAGIVPMVITADGQRAGATEQLAAFTRVLGIDLLVASQPAGLARALERRRDGAPVLIDAPGADLFDPAQREALAALVAATGAAIALVLPAGIDPGEAAEIAAAHAALGARLAIATRLDVARRLGSVLALGEAGLTLAEAGIGPGAADGMAALTPELLARRLMQAPHTAAIPQPEHVA